MEQYWNDILSGFNTDPQLLIKNTKMQEKLNMLSDYYHNGIWLDDYEKDNRGEFPANLKRGVLSQDTLYNFFMEIKE